MEAACLLRFDRFCINNGYIGGVLTREIVMNWLSSDSEGVKGDSPSTRNQRLACVKSYMKFSADKNISLSSLALQIHRIPPCKAPKPAVQAMSEKAIAVILRQPPNTKIGLRDRTFMVLLFGSGARVSEIINLKVRNLSLDGLSPQVRLEGKGKKTRTVPIMEKTVGHLRQYLSIMGFLRATSNLFFVFAILKCWQKNTVIVFRN